MQKALFNDILVTQKTVNVENLAKSPKYMNFKR